MRKLALILAGLSGVSFTVWAGNEPRGSLLELHSCEVYAGPCVINSESCSGGRYMLRAWNFTGGSFAGTELTGLRVALLQSSPDNLAAERTVSDRAMIYLPKEATVKQRDALAAWLKSTVSELRSSKVESRVVAIKFDQTASGYGFSAGKQVSVTTASREACATGACGEMLWYTPRTPTTVFTVAVNRASKVAEPALNLKWDDFGKRSVFLGKFGESGPSQNAFVNTTDLCSTSEKLF